jgi:hypothetical protein
MNVCLKCQTETKNKKFCSRSCSVSYNNSVKPKRQRTNYCKCGVLAPRRRKYCQTCFEKECRRDYANTTLASLRLETGSRNSYHTMVRQHARRVLENDSRLGACEVCGYIKHVEACHMRDVADFDESATLAEVNAPSNLKGLCPNHHWELDHELLPPNEGNSS